MSRVLSGSDSATGEPGAAPAAGATCTFDVGGMDCVDAVRMIEGKLGILPRIASLGFYLVGRRPTVEGEVTIAKIEHAVAQLGMRARLLRAQRGSPAGFSRRRTRTGRDSPLPGAKSVVSMHRQG